MERPRDRTAALAITLPPHATQALDEALSAVVRPEGAPLGPQARAVAVLTVPTAGDVVAAQEVVMRGRSRASSTRCAWMTLVGSFALAACAGDDTESGEHGGSGSGSDSASASASASGSASASSTSASTSASSTTDGGGPPPLGTCCSDCPEGTKAGDACTSYSGLPPCCTATELFTCDNLQCGSQSCVGTWTEGTCDCDARNAYFGSVLSALQVCDPQAGGATCQLSETLVDLCGCAAIVNTQAAGLAEAEAVQQAWMDAGCGPAGCGAPCIGEGTPACVGDEQYGYYCTLM
ncbi:MAG: hypothetical protein U0168_24710 [Nannocystaceae bacterium]